MDRMPQRIVEGLAKTWGPETWNYLGRPAVFTAVNAAEMGVLAGAAATKAAIEYGALKLPWYIARANASK